MTLDEQIRDLGRAVDAGMRAVEAMGDLGHVVVSIHEKPVAAIVALVDVDPEGWVLERTTRETGDERGRVHYLAALLHPTGKLGTRVCVFSEPVANPDLLPLNRGRRP